MREGLQPALIVGTVARFLNLAAMRRRQRLIVVRTVAGARRTAADSPHRWGTVASCRCASIAGTTTTTTTTSSADLMLQIRLFGQHLVQVMGRVMVMMMMTAPAVAGGRAVRRREIREQNTQVITPSTPHGRGYATHAAIHVLHVGLRLVMVLRLLRLLLVQVAMGGREGGVMQLRQMMMMLLRLMMMMMVRRGR